LIISQTEMKIFNRLRITLIITLFLFTTGALSLSAENVVLKDGSIYKGILIYLDMNKISLLVDETIYDFSLNTIEYIIKTNFPSSEEYSILLISRNNGTIERVNLIKMTERVLYYKRIDSEELLITNLSILRNISLISQNNTNTNDITGRITNANNNSSSQNDELSRLIQDFSSLNTDNQPGNPVISIEDRDFYEKIWLRINGRLNNNSERLLWNLLERYSEKEKSLNMMYSARINNANNQATVDILNEELRQTIISVRQEFAGRTRRFIIRSNN